MTAVSHAQEPPASKPVATIPPSMTLRGLLTARKKEGRRLALDEAVAVVVPVCLDLKARHDKGERVYVHPSAIAPGADGQARLQTKLATAPVDPHDRACLAPELQSDVAPGDARSSVFAIGAMLYEMITGESVGPAMKRPREVDPNLPEALEMLLGKALIGDRTHRPDDLAALASALYPLAPQRSAPPPSIPITQLDESAEFEVDVRLSLLPPNEVSPSANRIPRAASIPDINYDPFANAPAKPSAEEERAAAARRTNDPTLKLAELKMRLESDPRPRYVVIKDNMDHGPFSAVELLQQVAGGSFLGEDGLRDELSGQTRPILEWEEFAPFAQQADLKREIVAEKREVARAVKAEKKAGVVKYVVGSAVVVALVAAGAGWYVKARGERNDDVSVSDDPTLGDLDVKGGLKGQKRAAKPHAGGGGGGAAGGGFVGGMSYEAALNSNNNEVVIGKAAGPDLTNAQLSAPLANGAVLGACGTPASTAVTIKVAVKLGRAVGVSVYTTPPNPAVSGCIDRAVRGMSWPSNPKMDSFTTTFK
ncbi:MAG: hypothetical protein U0169_25450 [Polyangiaceae bacterium]